MTRLFKTFALGAMTLSTLVLTSCGIFEEPKQAARDFFDLLGEDVAAAYESTAPEFKAETTLEEFQAFLTDYPDTLEVANLSFNQIEMENNNYVELFGTVSYEAGYQESIGVYLYKHDVWQVGGFEMNY